MESNSVKSNATSWTGIAVLAVLVAILLAVVPASFDSDAEGDTEYQIYIDLGGEVASKILFDETVVDYGDPEWVTVTADSAKNALIAACEQKFGEGSLTLTSSGFIDTINGMSGNGITYYSDQAFTGDADQNGITYYPAQFIMEDGEWTYASVPIAAYEDTSTTFAVVCQPTSMDTKAVEFTFEGSAYAWDGDFDHDMYMASEYDLQSIYEDYFVGVYGWEYGTPSEPYIEPSKFKFYIDLGGTVSGFFLGTDADYGTGSWVTVTSTNAKDALTLACDKKFGEGSLVYKTTKYGTSIDTIYGMSGNGGSMTSEQSTGWADVYFYPVQYIQENNTWRSAEVTIPNYLGNARTFAVTFMPLTFDSVEHTFADENDQAVYELLKTNYAWPGYGQFEEPFFSSTSVRVSDSAITIAPGDTYQLTATVNPYTATNKNVTWYSYDESIATVDESGLVTAVAVGTVNIEVTSDYGSFTATTEVTVKEPVEYNIYIDLGGEMASAILLEDEVTDYGDPEWVTVTAVTAKDALTLACEQKFGEGSLVLTSSGYIKSINGMSGNGLAFFPDQSMTGEANEYGISYYPIQFIKENGAWEYASVPIAGYTDDSTTFAVVCQPTSMDTEAVDFTFTEDGRAYAMSWDTYDMYKVSDGYDLQSIYDDYFVGVYGWEYGTPSEPYFAPAEYQIYIDLGGTVSGFFLGTDADYGYGSWETVTATNAKEALTLACDQKFGEGSLVYKESSWGTSIDTINGMFGNGGSMKSEQAGSWDDVYYYPVQFICENDTWRQAEVTIPNYVGNAKIFGVSFMPLTFDAVEHTFADESDQAVYDLLKSNYAWPGYGQFESPFISLESISSDAEIELLPAEAYQINLTFNPDESTNKAGTWSSSNEDVAVVDENGLVTAVAAGTAVIEFVSDFGNYVADTNVTVSESVEYSIYIDLGGTVSAYFLETEADYGEGSWEVVTATSAKEALTLACDQKFGEGSLVYKESSWGTSIDTIYGMSGNGGSMKSEQAESWDDVYYYPVQYICEDDTWRSAEVTIPNYLGTARTFAITFMPLSFDAVEHTFADEADQAKYDLLKTTYAWPGYGQFETPFISLSSISVEESEVDIKLLDQYEIEVVYEPGNATNQNVTYSSSDPSVAIVTVDGVIQPKAAGTTEITVTSDYGSYTATIEVTVLELKTYEIYIDLGGEMASKILFDDIVTDYGGPMWSTVQAYSAKEAITMVCDERFGEGSIEFTSSGFIKTINGMSGDGLAYFPDQAFDGTAEQWGIAYYPMQFVKEGDDWKVASTPLGAYDDDSTTFAIVCQPSSGDTAPVDYTFTDDEAYAWDYGDNMYFQGEYDLRGNYENYFRDYYKWEYGAPTEPFFALEQYIFVGEYFESDGIIYYVESVDPYEVVVVGYEGAVTDVMIPEYATYKGCDLAVTEITPKAFYGCKTLKSIGLGNVSKVGVKAFARCSNLESVNGGDSLVTISAYAFFKCTKLENIDLYDAAETLRTYGSYSFYGCDNISEIIVPSYMALVSSNAFTLPFYDQNGSELDVSADSLMGYPYANVNAQFVQQPVAAIGTVFEDNNFEYTITSILPNFVEITGYVGTPSEIFVDEKVSYDGYDYKIIGIGDSVFKDYKGLTTIDAPDVRYVGKLAFYGCSNLKVAVLPGAEQIGVKAFAYCRALEEIEIDSLKNVQAYTFFRCTSLDTVLLNGITNIGTAAFYQCTSLEIVDMGDSVAKVLKNAFTGCNKLEFVEFSPALTWISSSAFGSTEFQDMDGNTVSSAEDLCGKTFIGLDGVLTETVPDEDN